MEKTKQFVDLKAVENEALLPVWKNMRKQFLDQVAELDAKIAAAEGRPVTPSYPPVNKNQITLPLTGIDYDKTWSLPKKMDFVIAEKGKLMTNREIANRIADYEPQFKKDKKSEYSLITQIAATVNYKVGKGKDFGRLRVEGKNDRIGQIGWFVNGIPKTEFM